MPRGATKELSLAQAAAVQHVTPPRGATLAWSKQVIVTRGATLAGSKHFTMPRGANKRG